MKWFQNRPRRACAVWLVAGVLPAVVLAQGTVVTPAISASDEAVAERMARAQRVANDPLRRIQQAARLGGGPGKAATPAAAAAVAAAPASAPPPQPARRQVTSVRAVAAAAPAASAAGLRPEPEVSADAVPASTVPVAPGLAAAAQPAVAAPATVAAAAPLTGPSAEPRGADQAAMSPQAVAALSPRASLPVVPPPAPAGDHEGDAPRLLEMVEPDFGSHGLREAGVLRFQVRFSIAADGHVTDVVVQGSAERALQRAVRDAVSRWRYAPPTRPMPHTVDLVVRIDA